MTVVHEAAQGAFRNVLPVGEFRAREQSAQIGTAFPILARVVAIEAPGAECGIGAGRVFRTDLAIQGDEVRHQVAGLLAG